MRGWRVDTCQIIPDIYQSDRNLDTLIKFKKAIRKEQSDNTKRIPKHFYYGPRKLNIIHRYRTVLN
jgi:hypothetical protein